MHDLFSSEAAPKRASDWKAVVARYQRPEVWRAIWQLTNTLVPYAALWWLIYASLSISLWLTLPLVVLASPQTSLLTPWRWLAESSINAKSLFKRSQ